MRDMAKVVCVGVVAGLLVVVSFGIPFAVLNARAASSTRIVGDSLTVGAKPYLACGPVSAWVGRSSRGYTPHAGDLIALGANDGAASPAKLRAAARAGARWATIWMPGRPGQSNRFNAALHAAGLGSPDWASYARTLPRSAWAGDGVHMSARGYRLRARFFNRYC